MKQTFERFENYINGLAKDFGWDIFIYDYLGIFRDGGKFTRSRTDAWHNNPYCLAVKSNQQLWNRCIGLKSYFNRRVIAAEKPYISTCFCGVAEYIYPVRIHSAFVCAFAVSGYNGTIKPSTQKIICKKTGISEDEYQNLRNKNLTVLNDGEIQKLFAYLGAAEQMVINIGENTPGFSERIAAGNEKTAYITRALQYIEHNYRECITANDVAKHCNLSLSHLQHLFTEALGNGVYAEILARRFTFASELLAVGDRSIKDIAALCGFKDTDYFSSAFKKRYGVTPNTFRKLRRNKNVYNGG